MLHRFYSTDLGPCPYLDNRQERRLVAVLGDGTATGERLDLLTENGFRRSQTFLYKPICPGCAACIPVRVVVGAFRPGRSFRKILARNADLVTDEAPAVADGAHFALFRRYLASRHADGGMAQMDQDAFRDMVEAAPASTRLVSFRHPGGRLIAASLTDHVRTGLSGVYKFFDPEEERRSLGTFMILWHVRRAAELGLPYVYLGYWIAECRKMAYKARFGPLEQLDGSRWLPLELPTGPA